MAALPLVKQRPVKAARQHALAYVPQFALAFADAAYKPLAVKVKLEALPIPSF
jgi:hypothetical protein